MKDKIKYYSKDTFKQEKNIETTIVLICVFLIGFIAGYICINNSAIENRQEINSVVIEEWFYAKEIT